jgi:predicted outer membrane repeat protein
MTRIHSVVFAHRATVMCRLCLVVSLGVAQPVGAAVFTVGTGPGCTHSSLQAALTASVAAAGADTIRLTRSIAYTQQNAQLNSTESVDVTGGYATCAQVDNDGTATTIDGSGGATEPVLRITASTGAVVKLERLTIRGGDEDGAGYGGGIYFRGNGTLAISRGAVTANTAGYGGGIYAEGTGTAALLVIGADVIVSANTARYSGGGIYVEGMQMEMREPGSTLAFNEALGLNGSGGYGGGLMLLSGAGYTEADIGSNGPGGLGAVYSNEARYGGGIALVAADDVDSYVQLILAGTAQSRAAIRGNFASVAGGAIYARPDIEVGSILVTTHDTRIALESFELSDNSAPDGAAVYLDSDSSLGYAGGALMNAHTVGIGVACAAGTMCGEISRNSAFDGAQLTNGAIIRLRDEAKLRLNADSDFNNYGRAGITMRGNRGGRLVYASEDSLIDLVNVVATGNQMSQELLRFAGEDDSHTLIRGMTIAGNEIGSANVITKFADTTIDSAIIWQPGKTTLQSNGGPLTVQTVIASEVGSLNAGPEAIVRDPRFVDPARGDYGLRAASPAVDAAIAMVNEKDALGNARNVDVPGVANSRGPRDIGAFERPQLQPLVLNADFDADMNLWNEIFAGVSSWTNEQNASGASGSGSIKVSQVNVAYGQAIRGRSQCIHLPGPGIYALNGRGRGTGNFTVPGDMAMLHWEYRRNGGEACTQGAANTTGDLLLASQASWSRPANPARIAVTPAEWMFTSSITISLVGVESGVSGSPRTTSTWFDGITLELEGSDTLFKQGFDP